MKQKMRNRLFEIFEDKLSCSCSGFSKDKRYSINERVIFRRAVSEGLMLFVCLSIVDFKEGFTLDLACSEDGDYPFSFQFLGDWHHVRLPDLAGLRKDGEEYFWQIATPPSLGKLMKHVEKGMPLREPNVSDEKLAEVVDEAVKVFKEYGIAFFDKVASDKGLKIQWN